MIKDQVFRRLNTSTKTSIATMTATAARAMYRVVEDELSVTEGVVVVDWVGEALAEVEVEGDVVGVDVGCAVVPSDRTCRL